MSHDTRKKENAKINYTIDLAPALDADETVLSASWSFDEDDGNVKDLSASGGPKIIAESLVGTDATVRVEGGTKRKSYKVYLTAPTSKGQIIVDDITLRII